MKVAQSKKVALGDFQTSPELARQCCLAINRLLGPHEVIVEPTCGEGNFLAAAIQHLRPELALGFEYQEAYARRARRRTKQPQLLTGSTTTRIEIRRKDFFSFDWMLERERWNGRVLFFGNPPWVTNSALGRLGSTNLPTKSNVQRLAGMEAMTGRSNFDIAESILQTLIDVMKPKHDSLAMLVKTATARKVARIAWSQGKQFAKLAMHRIDAKQHFGVTVDACLLMLQVGDPKSRRRDVCMQSPDLTGAPTQFAFGWDEGRLVADPVLAKATRRFAVTDPNTKAGPTSWRSGVKHDLSSVLEFAFRDGQLRLPNGETVTLELDRVFPLAKGSDVANGRNAGLKRKILLPQRSMGESTDQLRTHLPLTYQYLCNHEAAFNRRRSSIYRGRDRFAVFGLGDYTFANWKVGVCGLYKHLGFTVFGPIDGKPVILDDTAYQLAFESQRQAELVKSLLDTDACGDYFHSRIFWDAKRPITAELLRSLDLVAIADATGHGRAFRRSFGSKTGRP